VCFTGYVFGDGYRELARNAAIFVVPTEAGSTHPVIVEAMAAGNCVVVNDYQPNMETIGDAGVSYHGPEGAADLQRVLAELLEDPARVERYRELAAARARAEYSWDAVTDGFENVAKDVVAQRSARGQLLR
jgi:glycosyltransferase involved in cell wall biosynthesis